jgi:gamma-glutamylcyclotransferase (GGCT)/AIG2-like uncharacterized protein YtfP
MPLPLIPNGSLCAVYGTLRADMGNHRILASSVRQEDGVISGSFKMYSLGGFPMVITDQEPVDIVVEVYEVGDQSVAQSLDWLEGYPGFYDRKLVTLVDGRRCWVYYNDTYDHLGAEIPSGDWKVHCNNR